MTRDRNQKRRRGRAVRRARAQEGHPPVVALAAAPQAQIVPSIEVPLPPTPDQVLAMAERQIKIRKGYLRLVARELRPQDVLVFGNRATEEVYLPAKPCRDILSWARITVAPHWPTEEHHYASPDGEYIEFVITATITDGSGRSVDVIGNRSTRDEFFGIAGKDFICPHCRKPVEKRFAAPGDKYKSWACTAHGRVKPEVVVRYLPLHDVDVPSVRQAAVTNLWNHALKAVGLCPTLSDLHDEGMDISKVKRIGFASRSEEDEPQATVVKPNDGGTAPPQSTQQPKPAAATASAAAPPAGKPAGKPADKPEPAIIPGEESTLKGTIEMVHRKDRDGKPLTTRKGTPFRKVEVGRAEQAPVTVYIFDNATRAAADGAKHSVFELLDRAALGAPCAFVVRPTDVKGKVMLQAATVLLVGDFEWEADGTPVIRRDAADPKRRTREPGEDEGELAFPSDYQASDADILI